MNQLAKENRAKKMQAQEKMKKEEGQHLGEQICSSRGFVNYTKGLAQRSREIHKDLCSNTPVKGGFLLFVCLRRCP